MKFSTALASLLVIAPFLLQDVVAAPQGGALARRAGAGGKGNAGKGNAQANKGNGQANNQGKGGAAAAAAAAAAKSSAASNTATAAAAAATNGSNNAGDAQTSTTLLNSVIATGFENNGQATPEAGQVASLTSSNNFINFCATVSNLPITNGQQVTGGSCNPAPMGVIPSTSNMPSSKFVSPKNNDNIAANTPFNITMAIQNMATGFFVNAQENYFAAPQQTNAQGQVQGHSHVVIEALSSITQTTPTNPSNFAFFKGLNDAAVNGQLTAEVSTGLPAGTYRLASINTAANHQPILVAVAQHGSLDDMVYFTVGGAGNNNAGNNNAGAGGAAAASSASAAASAASSAAAGKGAAGKGAAGAAAAGKGAAAAGKGAAAGAAAGKGAANGAAKGGAAKGKNGRRFLRDY